MVGRKPSILPQTIKEELLKHTIHDESCKLKGKNNEVWKDISRALGDKIQGTSIHLMVHQNRHELKSSYEKAKGILIVNTYESSNQKENDFVKAISNEGK